MGRMCHSVVGGYNRHVCNIIMHKNRKKLRKFLKAESPELIENSEK